MFSGYGGGGQARRPQFQSPRGAVGDDVDGLHSGTSVQNRGHLLHTIAIAIKHDDFHGRPQPAGQFCVIRNRRIDEGDLAPVPHVRRRCGIEGGNQSIGTKVAIGTRHARIVDRPICGFRPRRERMCRIDRLAANGSGCAIEHHARLQNQIPRQQPPSARAHERHAFAISLFSRALCGPSRALACDHFRSLLPLRSGARNSETLASPSAGDHSVCTRISS